MSMFRYRRISEDKVVICHPDGRSFSVNAATITAALQNAEENPQHFGRPETLAAYKAMYEGAKATLSKPMKTRMQSNLHAVGVD